MKATVHGRFQKMEIDVTNVYPEDEAFFEENDIKISMEELQGRIIVYADYGATIDGEPKEVIVISHDKACEDMLQELAAEVKNAMLHTGKLP